MHGNSIAIVDAATARGNNIAMDNNIKKEEQHDASTELKRYEPPRVAPLGKVVDITLGGSLGSGDSGNFGVEDPFSGT